MSLIKINFVTIKILFSENGKISIKIFREIDSSNFTSFLTWPFLNFLAHHCIWQHELLCINLCTQNNFFRQNHEYEFKNDDAVVLSFLAGDAAAGSKADLFEFPAEFAKDLNPAPELAAEEDALLLLSPLLLLFKFIFSKILLVFDR